MTSLRSRAWWTTDPRRRRPGRRGGHYVLQYIYISFQSCNVVACESRPGKAIPYALPWARTLCPALNLIFSLFRHLIQQPSSSPPVFTLVLYVSIVLAVVDHSELIVYLALIHLRPSTIHSKYISASSTRLVAFSVSELLTHRTPVCRCLNLVKTLSTSPSSPNRLSVMKASHHLCWSCAPNVDHVPQRWSRT